MVARTTPTVAIRLALDIGFVFEPFLNTYRYVIFHFPSPKDGLEWINRGNETNCTINHFDTSFLLFATSLVQISSRLSFRDALRTCFYHRRGSFTKLPLPFFPVPDRTETRGLIMMDEIPNSYFAELLETNLPLSFSFACLSRRNVWKLNHRKFGGVRVTSGSRAADLRGRVKNSDFSSNWRVTRGIVTNSLNYPRD